jgi:hypothetical protein
MIDYSHLRGEAVSMGARDIRIAASELIAILDELDALRAATKPAKRTDYPPEFEQAYKACKWRQGSTRAAAYKAWKARIVAGASPAELLTGAEKYGRYCAATGCEVKMAQTFFGPGEHFTADWTVRTAPSNLGKAGQATARAAMDWMGSE